MRQIKTFFSFLYCLDAYVGCERITLWDRIYKRRIGIRRAWRISKNLKRMNKQYIVKLKIS